MSNRNGSFRIGMLEMGLTMIVVVTMSMLMGVFLMNVASTRSIGIANPTDIATATSTPVSTQAQPQPQPPPARELVVVPYPNVYPVTSYTRPVFPPRQCGIIAATLPSGQKILPLFAQESPTRRGRYLYATRTDAYVPVLVAVHSKGRDCSQELACEEIYDGDQVRVPAYGEVSWTVTLYRT